MPRCPESFGKLRGRAHTWEGHDGFHDGDGDGHDGFHDQVIMVRPVNTTVIPGDDDDDDRGGQ